MFAGGTRSSVVAYSACNPATRDGYYADIHVAVLSSFFAW